MPRPDGERLDAEFVRLREEVCIWRHNRSLYPGWLIAPYQTRDKIWTNTKYWIAAAVDTQKLWPDVPLAILWRELSWRLDLCLHIVPDRALEPLRHIAYSTELSSVFTDAGDLSLLEFSNVEDWPDGFKVTVEEFAHDWKECVLAYFSACRIRPDIDEFEKVRTTLLDLGNLTQDQQCRVYYESCLLALSEFDHDGATQFLKNWPTDVGDPYWPIRKASVLLELGDREAARSIATDALQQVRKLPRGESPDYWRLSREGWCLHFLHQIQQFQRLSLFQSVEAPTEVEDELEDDLDSELERMRCSPSTELRMLEERIAKRIAPIRRPFVTRTQPSFDDAWTSERHHFGTTDTPERLSEAINVLRACELTGITPRLDNVDYFTSAVSAALRWIRNDHSGLWAAFALRYRGIGIETDVDPLDGDKHDSIRRTTLEKLPLPHIRRLFNASLKELERLASVVESNTAKDGNANSDQNTWSIRTLAEVVTRFSLCMDDDSRKTIFSITLSLAKLEIFQRHTSFQQTIYLLVKRTVPYFSVEDLNRHMIELLIKFPLLRHRERETDRWPLITDYIRFPKDASLDRPDGPEFHEGIERLVSFLDDDQLIVRTDAAVRLAFLSREKLLTESETHSFVDALWKRVDATGLPLVDDAYVSKLIHLDWPAVARQRSLDGLVEWVLSQNVVDRYSKSDDGESTIGGRLSLSSSDPDTFLHSLSDIAVRLRREPEIYPAVYSSASRDHILQSVLNWWDREGHLYKSHSEADEYFKIDPIDRIDLAIRVIIECALHADSGKSAASARLSAFVRDVEDLQRPIPYCYPLLAYLKPDSQRYYWDQLLISLWNADQQVAVKAVVACLVWQRSVERLQLQPMPHDVFVAVVGSLVAFSGELSYTGYDVVRALVGEDLLKDQPLMIKKLTDAVERAADRLGYGRESRIALADVGFEEEMQVHYRRRLAGLLYTMLEKQIDMGPIATRWYTAAKRDRFVDVRQSAVTGRI